MFPRLLLKLDMRPARFMLAIGSMVWFVCLIWPILFGTHLFPTPPQLLDGTGRMVYTIMAQIGPEWFWATLFGFSSLFTWASLFFRVPPVACFIDALNGAMLWSFVTGACLFSEFHSWSTFSPPATMGMEVAAVLASWWWLVRVIIDKEYEAKH